MLKLKQQTDKRKLPKVTQEVAEEIKTQAIRCQGPHLSFALSCLSRWVSVPYLFLWREAGGGLNRDFNWFVYLILGVCPCTQGVGRGVPACEFSLSDQRGRNSLILQWGGNFSTSRDRQGKGLHVPFVPDQTQLPDSIYIPPASLLPTWFLEVRMSIVLKVLDSRAGLV